MRIKDIERILSNSVNELNEITNRDLERRDMINIANDVSNDLKEILIQIQKGDISND